MALGIALRYVLEALRKAPGSKMYMFGTTALDRFKIRLKDYPHYCQHLASIPHYKEFPVHLVEYIGFGQRNQEPPNPVISRTSMVSFVVFFLVTFVVFFALILGQLLNSSSYSPLDKWQVLYNLNVIPFCKTDRPKKSLTVRLIHKSNLENKSVLRSERESSLLVQFWLYRTASGFTCQRVRMMVQKQSN